MLDRAEDFLGRVTFVTGPEKHCGKTTFLNRALSLARAAGERPAFLSIGYDGEARDSLSAARKPSVPVSPGDVVVSAERFLRDSRILPEILEALSGSSAFGRICVARARRPGRLVLVGPEGNEGVARALYLPLRRGGSADDPRGRGDQPDHAGGFLAGRPLRIYAAGGSRHPG